MSDGKVGRDPVRWKFGTELGHGLAKKRRTYEEKKRKEGQRWNFESKLDAKRVELSPVFLFLSKN